LNTLLGSARRFPQLPGDLERVNAEALPPYTLISGVMGFAMVCAAKRDSEFVAHLEAQAAWLHEAKVMRIGGFAGADEARLLRDVEQMSLVAVALVNGNTCNSTVDPLRMCAPAVLAFILLWRAGLGRNVSWLGQVTVLRILPRQSS
jgi:hypothetical protein